MGESRLFSAVARDATWQIGKGASPALVRAGNGPYDQRLGLSRLPEFVSRLEARGYQVISEARNSSVSLFLSRLH